jgi:hypothetical protein
MRLYRVADITVEELPSRQYDLAIFASGFEERCIHVAGLVTRENVDECIVFGFQEGSTDFSRPTNDDHFEKNWVDDITIARDDNSTAIYDRLRHVRLKENGTYKILVDYSTMSRLWYGSILNWIRYSDGNSNIEVDFLYSRGVYKDKFSPLVIEDILAIPGFEGSPISDAQSLAIFGLGFDGIAALGAFDQIEPNIVYAYLASPGASEGYAEQAKKENKLFLSEYVRKLLEIPIYSVEVTLKRLTELISPHRGETNIIIIPMGPKPHVLAAMLLCLRFEKELTCLRVRGKRKPRVDVEARGSIVATRVYFKPHESAQRVIADSVNLQQPIIPARLFKNLKVI